MAETNEIGTEFMRAPLNARPMSAYGSACAGHGRLPHTRRLASALGAAAARVCVCLLMLLGKLQATEQAAGNVPTLSDKDALISWVLDRFWGHARDSTGAVIQPSSELDRRTVPVPLGVAYRVIEAGEISGLADWCGLKWEAHYQSLTSAARQRKMSDKSVAFISVLHGVAQGITSKSRSSPCSDSERNLVAAKLESSRRIGLGPVE